MKHFNTKLLLASTLLAGTLASCTDDSYNLSDVDTTSRINVNDLVVPVKLETIRMESIIEPDGLLQVKNNQYCIVKEGDKEDGKDYAFSSDPIRIDPVTLEVKKINSSQKDLDVPPLPTDIPTELIPEGENISFPLVSEPERLDIGAEGVPVEITAIEEIGTHLEVSFTLSLNGFDNNLKQFYIKDLKLKLPKNLQEVNAYGNTYHPQTGILDVKDQYISGHSADLKFSCNKINLAATEIKFFPKDHEIKFNGELGVTDGEAIVYLRDITDLKKVPSKINYTVNYKVNNIPVKTFSGGLDYQVSEITIPEISLGDLPDVLTQSGTNISLVNPQIYLSLNNPIASNFSGDKPVGSIGLNIKAKRVSDDDKVEYSDCPMDGRIDLMPQEHVKYVLSPSAEGLLPPKGYEDAKHEPYTNLSNIVAGNGLPKALIVQPESPIIDASHVKNLRLGTDLGRFTGDYYLIAPLQLAENSTIIYKGTTDGWADGDLDKLTINTLAVTANVTTDVPVEVVLTMEPVNSEGDVIPTENPVHVTIPANAKDRKFELELKGEIRDLDGVQYVATATAAKDGQTLSENMTIDLKQIRAKVSGYYTTDF